MHPVIYYRSGRDVSEDEVLSMQKHFDCVTSRMNVKAGDLCIARYSCWPYYKDLEEDLESIGAKLINTYRQHRWIADIGNWVEDLKGLTPDTWRRLEDVPEDAFPIIVKGETNGKKFLWDTHFFAKDRTAACDVRSRLQDDGLISNQWLYFRRFVPLKTYLTGFRGVPISKEFRVFVCDGVVLSKAYYWSNYFEDLPEKPDVNDIPIDFLQQVISCIGNRARFYVVDVAQTEKGDWIVIELNDGQMSGLSENDPDVLYTNLKSVLK